MNFKKFDEVIIIVPITTPGWLDSLGSGWLRAVRNLHLQKAIICTQYSWSSLYLSSYKNKKDYVSVTKTTDEKTDGWYVTTKTGKDVHPNEFGDAWVPSAWFELSYLEK